MVAHAEPVPSALASCVLTVRGHVASRLLRQGEARDQISTLVEALIQAGQVRAHASRSVCRRSHATRPQLVRARCRRPGLLVANHARGLHDSLQIRAIVFRACSLKNRGQHTTADRTAAQQKRPAAP